MKLNLKERLIIPNILPTEGNYTTLVIKSDLLNKIKTTQEEIKECNIKSENGVITWDKDIEKEFEFTELELNLVIDTLKKLDNEKKLNDDTLIIYKKFIS